MSCCCCLINTSHILTQSFPFPKLDALLQISWPLFTFCAPNLAPFSTWNTTSSNLLTETQKFQAICRTKSNAASPSFDSTTCWYQLHPQYHVLQQEKCLSYPPDCMSRVTETPNCEGAPFESL